MRISATFLPLSLAVLLVSSVPAQSRLLVTSQRDHTFHVLDPVTLQELSSTQEDEDAGHEIVATPDGKTAFVPIYGNSGVGKPGSDGDHIEKFDVATGKSIGTIKFSHGVRPHRPLWDAHTGMMLVSTELDKSASIVDPKTGRIVGSIPTGAEQSHMITLLPSGKKLYSANVHPGSVSVMDVQARKLLKIIPVSDNTQRLSCSTDGRYVFTSDQTAPELVVIDTAADKIAKRIKLPAVGYGSTPTPDGKYLLVAMAPSSAIAVVDLMTLEVARTIPAIEGLNEIAVSQDSRYAYGTAPHTNQLIKIDLSNDKTVKTVTLGKFPDGMWLTASR